MPQLDKVTYFTQVVYFAITMIACILYINYFVIPTVFKNVKFRYYLIQTLSQNIDNVNSRKEAISATYDSDISFFIKKIYSSLNNIILSSDEYLNTNKKKYIISDRTLVTERLNDYKNNHQIFNLRKECQ